MFLGSALFAERRLSPFLRRNTFKNAFHSHKSVKKVMPKRSLCPMWYWYRSAFQSLAPGGYVLPSSEPIIRIFINIISNSWV